MKVWIVIAVVGLLNYCSRLSFIAFFARRSVPAPLARALRYVPAAMLTALIVPMIVLASPMAPDSTDVPRIVAAILGGIVAFRTRNVLLTLGFGMATLWSLQMLLRAN